MLALSTLREIPDELANRMMMAHGSANLLRAIRGEPLAASPIEEPKRTVTAIPLYTSRYVPVAERKRIPMPDNVLAIANGVAEAFDIPLHDLMGKNRAIRLVCARAVFYRLVRDLRWPWGEGHFSYAQIGAFTGRDHSTVHHAVDSFNSYCKRFPEMREVYDRLRGGQ